ncbi:ester cyclase [Streptomyces caeni]|uniref:Ester cyclase n=1 Tax=Streptomyces caeni TaxID=2307231 RepID=A0ABW4IRB7_9ACTN
MTEGSGVQCFILSTRPSEGGGGLPAESPLDQIAEQVRTLSDRASLSELVDRYMVTLDEGPFDDDWAKSLFTEDISLVFPVGSHQGIAGAADFTQKIMNRWERTHHHGSGTVIELDGDRASISWSLIASHVHFGSPRPPAPTSYFQLGGRFDGVAQRTPRGWRIKSLKLRIVWSTGAVPSGVTSVDATTVESSTEHMTVPQKKGMADMASAERQKEIVEEIFREGLTNGDLSVADKHLTADFKNNGSHDDSMRGPEAFKHTIRIQQSAFSDIKYEILDFVSQGDRAAARWVMYGRHTGPFLGVQPTGLEVEHNAIIWFRFEGEKIAERWGIVDNFTTYRFLTSGGKPGGPLTPGGPGAGKPGPA